MTTPIVEISGLRKTYRRGDQEITPLDGVSLTINEGEFVAFMGPSGSGKTTLLNIVAGIDSATAGNVKVAGTDIRKLSDSQLAAWRNATVGYIFQFFNLMPVLTATENVELPLLLLPISAKRRREQALTALNLVGLSDRAHHYPRQLSGGQEQRVAIARAIATDPRIIVADEPTGNLDAHSETEVLALLGELNRRHGKTIIMVTHDTTAANVASRVLHLDKGIFREGQAADMAHGSHSPREQVA